jgi:urease accessory protein UreH
MAPTSDKKLGQLRLDLEHVVGGMVTYAAELGDVSAERAQAEAIVDELKRLNDRQEQLKAETEAVTRQLAEKSAAARDLLTRLRNLAKAKLGTKNQALEAFGIRVSSR